MFSIARHSLLLLSIVLLSVVTVSAQDPIDLWKNFDFSENAIKQSDIQKLNIWDLKLMRGLVFGRHGRIFKDADIKNYLEAQVWYQPDPEFKNSMLNDTERRNLDLIRIADVAAETERLDAELLELRGSLLAALGVPGAED